jgi:predicted enzyme related to lactoylglutathione lyase
VNGAAYNYIIVDDIDALYREISGCGVKVLDPPEEAPLEAAQIIADDPPGRPLLSRCFRAEAERRLMHDKFG